MKTLGPAARVALQRDPLNQLSRTQFTVEEGVTLREGLNTCNYTLPESHLMRVTVNGKSMLSATWDSYLIQEGDMICGMGVPQGGGPTIAVISLIITVISAGVSYIQTQKALDALGGEAGRNPGFLQSPSLSGQGNAVRQYAPIPDVYGTHLQFGPHLADPHAAGGTKQQSAIMLIGLSHGPCDLLDTGNPLQPEIRVGERLLHEVVGATWDFHSGDVDEPLTIYTKQLVQDNFQVPFDIALGNEPRNTAWIQKTTGTAVKKISLTTSHDGVYATSENGSTRSFNYRIHLQYREVGSGTWLNVTQASGFKHTGGRVDSVSASGVKIGNFHRNPFFKTFSWEVTEGQYEVRMRRRETQPATNRDPAHGERGAVIGSYIWTNITGFRNDPVWDTSQPICTLEVQIPMTEEDQGSVGQVSALIQRKIRAYDPGGVDFPVESRDSRDWTDDPVLTANPAAVYRNLWQGTAYLGPTIGDDDIDLDRIESWYTSNRTLGRDMHVVFDSQETMVKRAEEIANGGRATFDMVDGKVSVGIEEKGKTPVQMISARNSHEVEVIRNYGDILHALVLERFDPDSGYDPSGETTVYADGFDEGTATLIERQRLVGAWTDQEAWEEGRVQMALRQLRPRVITCRMDFEQLVARRKDIVIFASDEALIGQTSGRVKEAGTFTTLVAFDGTTNFLFGPPPSAAVDSADFKSGTASNSYSFASSGTAYSLILGAGLDWSTSVWRGWIKPGRDYILSDTDGFRILLDSGSGNTSTWYIGRDKGMFPGIWHQLTIDFANEAADATTGSGVDLSSITSATFRVNDLVNQTTPSQSFKLDQFESIDRSEVLTVELDNDVMFEDSPSYGISFRIINTSNVIYDFQNADVLNPLMQNDPDLYTRIITLEAALTGATVPLAGDLWIFGQRGVEYAEMIVEQVEPLSDLGAKLLLRDYAEAAYDAHLTNIPTFDPGTTLPVPPSIIGPSTPSIDTLISDERALHYNQQGFLVPRVYIEISHGFDSSRHRPIADAFQVYAKVNDPENGEGEWRLFGTLSASTPQGFLEGFDQGLIYDFEVRAVVNDGRSSLPALFNQHSIEGTSNPPPDVEAFRIEGNVLSWSMSIEPLDLSGYIIKTGIGDQVTWDNAVKAHVGIISQSPQPLDTFPGGRQTILIKAVDLDGNESVNSNTIITTLTPFTPDNVVLTTDYHAAGFPRIADVEKNNEVYDDFDLGIGPWIPFGCTASLDTNESYDVGGSLDLVGNSGSFEMTLLGISLSLDWTNRTWSVWLMPVSGPTDVAVVFNSETVFTQNFSGLVTGQWNQISGTVPPSAAPNITAMWIQFPGSFTGDQWKVDLLETQGGGTLETTEVESPSGDLITQTTSTFWSGNDSVLFWLGIDSALFYTAVYFDGTWRFDFQPDNVDLPARLSFDLDVDGNNLLEYRSTGDNLFWSSNSLLNFWSGTDSDSFWNPLLAFAPWPGKLDLTHAAALEFRYNLPGGTIQGRVRQFDALLDVPDIVEVLEDVSVPNSGTFTLSLAKTYRAIKIIKWAVQGVAGVVVVNDKAITGPDVEVQNLSGVRIAADTDFELRGY